MGRGVVIQGGRGMLGHPRRPKEILWIYVCVCGVPCDHLPRCAAAKSNMQKQLQTNNLTKQCSSDLCRNPS